MRTMMLIAAMALTSAVAHAGETRGLSTAAAPSDVPVAATATPANATRYTDNVPPATASTASSSTAQPARRYDDKGYYDDAGYHPLPRRYTSAERATEPSHRRAVRPHQDARWSAERIIAELHRYGIEW
jgi:hypothetical protein